MSGQAATEKKILFYYHPNKRSIATESLCSEINKSGTKLIVLTQTERGDLHEQLDTLGVENYAKAYNSRFSIINYIRHFFYLLKFCRKHKINVIWSHLNSCNLVSVFAQYFTKARVVIFRHHFHASIKIEGFKSVNKNELRVDRIINRLAKEFVVPSMEVYNGMIKYEKVKPGKIAIIPYVYDFSKYAKPNPAEVQHIKNAYPAKLLIITASRMIKMKRHDLVLPVYNKLIKEGLDIKVLLMDEGEERPTLEKYVADNGLSERIFFLGFRRNIIDFLAASDLLVHPSYTEASSSLVKEFGLMKKPVIVCTGVGDFDQYIFNKENGFVVKPPDEAAEFEEYIRWIYDNKPLAEEMGRRLHDSVVRIFSPGEQTMNLYKSKIY